MRKGTGREDKLHTHFGGTETTPDQLERHYAQWIDQSPNEEWKRFVQGYFAHVLTDYLWGLRVYADFKSQALQDGIPESDIKTFYYTDTDGVDFALYENSVWKKDLWESLVKVPACAMEPLLSEQEIDGWRVRTIRWFEDPANKPKNPPRLITREIVEVFIEQAGDEIRTILYEWDQKLSTPSLS
ncbi:hypothetical protein [Saccharibacillus sacchari]|uniref:Uncharacterized protein n=1 Tax=Saccharibacillus sacchari TaxID=456493 RepID=A0ACC6P714_9BACL